MRRQHCFSITTQEIRFRLAATVKCPSLVEDQFENVALIFPQFKLIRDIF